MKSRRRLTIVPLLAFVLVAAPLFAAPLAGSSHPPAEGAGLWHFLLTALTIFGINFVLSGDNGVVIAVAVATLQKEQKIRALCVAAVLAVLLQGTATFFAAMLLHLRFIQLAGGLLVIWIAVNLFRGDNGGRTAASNRHSFWKAIWLIVAAELTMSTDNIFTVAAIAKGDVRVLIAGLAPSIVLVIFASGVLSLFVGRFPLILFGGAAILANVGADMVMTDAFTTGLLKPDALLRHSIQAAAAIGVIAAGYVMQKQQAAASVIDSN
jgi:YjbE family integral membrane protein